MIVGIIAGITAALLQSLSYVFSASFMCRYRSPIRLLLFSQLGMGLLSMVMLFFFFPTAVFEQPLRFTLYLLAWILVFVLGQSAFFNTLRRIEASRTSSLLGLKIIVLAVFSIVLLRQPLTGMQGIAVLISTIAAIGMNWSGGARFSLSGMLWLFLTLVAYSLADITETEIVRLFASGNMIHDAFKAAFLCYFVLGIFSAPLLLRYRWTKRQFVKAFPFALAWLFSQVALLACFGLLGALFGNVIQSSRGIISVLVGILLAKIGMGKYDSTISRAMWIRRAVCSVLMALGIILYAAGGAAR